MVKEKPQIEESEKEIAMRKEFRKEWSEIEPKLVEMAHKSEDNGLIENKDYIWLKSRISNLSKGEAYEKWKKRNKGISVSHKPILNRKTPISQMDFSSTYICSIS